MKRISLLLLTILSIEVFAQKSTYTDRKNLSDGETIKEFYNVPDENKFLTIKYANAIISNPILQTMGVEDEFFDDIRGKKITPADVIKDQLKLACNRIYTDGSINIKWELINVKEMDNFAKKVLKNHKVRKFLVNIVADILSKLCEHYPKDFKYKCVNELKECIAFVDNMPKHKYDIIGGDLFVDGEANYELGWTMKGFILRRIIKDKMPKQEIREHLNTLLKKVESVDVSNNDDIIYSLIINNELKYCVSATGSYFIINEKKVKKEPCRHNNFNSYCSSDLCLPIYSWAYNTCYPLNSIKKVGTNYIIDYGDNWSGHHYKVLIDRTGEIVYEEEY